MRWEYQKINLNDAARRGDEIDLLCDAGADGWELIDILSNNIAYLKRAHPDDALEPAAQERGELSTSVKPKYRDPVTGETWSGRGRMATWLKRKQDAGEDIEKMRT